jgi:hypothetical protein
MVWRAFLGFCWTDESFYISTADRFYKGDIPLVKEWYRTQMSSIIMLPLYHLYMMIAGSNAGIVLYFRLVYLALTLCVSILYYRVLEKEYPKFIAGASGLFILIYAHLNMATFSYYMMSSLFLSIALILVYDHKNSQSRLKLIIAGIMTALAVMSMPAFVVVYVLIMAAVFVMMIVGKNRKELGTITLYTIVGIAIPAVPFVIYLFSHMSLDYLIETLPYVLVDNEHSNTFGYFIRKPHRCMVAVFGTYVTWASYAIIAVSFVFAKFLKKHPIRELFILANCVLFAVMTYVSFGHVGYVSVAFFVFIVPLYFISEKKNRGLFFVMVVPAALVALVYCFASSDFLYIMALGFQIATGAGICIVYNLSVHDDGPENNKLMKAVSALCALACVSMLVITFALRLINVYRDAPVNRLTARIPGGIAKGLYTTEEHLEQYNDVYEMINGYCTDTSGFEIISGNPKGNVLFSKILPWGYTAGNLSCGYPTTWRSTAYNKEQLDLYYDINKNSRPDVIIILDSKYGSYDASGDVEDDHEPNLDEMPDYWWDYIRDNGFDEIRVKCGRVYCRQKQ